MKYFIKFCFCLSIALLYTPSFVLQAHKNFKNQTKTKQLILNVKRYCYGNKCYLNAAHKAPMHKILHLKFYKSKIPFKEIIKCVVSHQFLLIPGVPLQGNISEIKVLIHSVSGVEMTLHKLGIFLNKKEFSCTDV